jgi:predicted nuclease of predicted toxin-antitoxin system
LRLLLDQNLSPTTARFLRDIGLEAHDIRERGLSGASDEQVYAHAAKENLILVTFDITFSRRYISGRDLPGLILLRIHPQTTEVLHPVLADFFSRFGESKLSGCIAVVERHRYRVRKLR